MSITETDVQNALKSLIDPNTKKDFVSGKSIKNIKISGTDVSLEVLLGYPAKSVWDEIRTMVETHLKSTARASARSAPSYPARSYRMQCNAA